MIRFLRSLFRSAREILFADEPEPGPDPLEKAAAITLLLLAIVAVLWPRVGRFVNIIIFAAQLLRRFWAMRPWGGIVGANR